MAFSLSFMLKKIRESEIENTSEIKEDNSEDAVDNISMLVTEALNSILLTVSTSIDEGIEISQTKTLETENSSESVRNAPNEKGDTETYCNINTEQESYESVQLFNFINTPLQVTGAWTDFSTGFNNYTRGCKWAPDGSCILTCSNDNILKIFNLPVELWDTTKWQDMPEMASVLNVAEGEIVYDFSWYPLMNSTDPCSCCFASCSRNSTVHLWDAFTGKLRCSYRSYDQMDEITAPRSLSFDVLGERIFCGFEKVIRVFNLDSPGRNCVERRTFEKKSGQPGIISCFAFSSANRSISAAGSYQKTIGIYSEPDGQLECVLEGHRGGLTNLQFSPDGNLLYSGGRKDSDILCWDIRNFGEILYCMRRNCSTNQRMYFDISRDGRYVISGNTNGVLSVWDTTNEPKDMGMNDFNVLEPIQFFLAHNDCVNGISIHPTYPLMCSSSGQRHFPDLLSDDEEEGIFTSQTIKSDNSLRLWWIGS